MLREMHWFAQDAMQVCAGTTPLLVKPCDAVLKHVMSPVHVHRVCKGVVQRPAAAFAPFLKVHTTWTRHIAMHVG